MKGGNQMLESSMLRVLLSSGQECWDLCFHGHRVCHFHLSRSHCHCQLHHQCFLQNEQWKITAINFNNAIFSYPLKTETLLFSLLHWYHEGPIESRTVLSCFHGSKFLELAIFLMRDGHFCFWVQSCVGKSYVSIFLLCLHDHALLNSRNLGTMAMWCNYVSSLFHRGETFSKWSKRSLLFWC